MSRLNEKRVAGTWKNNNKKIKNRNGFVHRSGLDAQPSEFNGGHSKHLCMKNPHHFKQDMTCDPHK